MNILAEEQLKMLDSELSENERKKQEEHFYKLYYELRKKDEGSIFLRVHILLKMIWRISMKR